MTRRRAVDGTASCAHKIRDVADVNVTSQGDTSPRQEMAPARAEMTQKGAQVRFGIGLFGAAGILSLYGLGALIASGILLLSTATSIRTAAIPVAAIVLLIGWTLSRRRD